MKHKFFRESGPFVGLMFLPILMLILSIWVSVATYKNGGGWNIKDSLGFLLVAELIVCPGVLIYAQTVHMDKEKVVVKWLFFTIRTIYWCDVVQTGVAKVYGSRSSIPLLYISKRKLSMEELKYLRKAKNKEDFIFMDAFDKHEALVKKYSPVEFREEPDVKINMFTTK